jgi:hypothetical protein
VKDPYKNSVKRNSYCVNEQVNVSVLNQVCDNSSIINYLQFFEYACDVEINHIIKRALQAYKTFLKAVFPCKTMKFWYFLLFVIVLFSGCTGYATFETCGKVGMACCEVKDFGDVDCGLGSECVNGVCDKCGDNFKKKRKS